MRLDSLKCLGPVCGDQLAIRADIGFVQTAVRKAIDGMACFVRRPFFVYIIIDTRQRAQHGPAPAIQTDIGANSIHYVNAWRFLQFPRTRFKSIRLRRQSADRAQINDIAR